MKNEGPFGEFTGYYAGGMSPKPVISVKALYHRDNPIITGTAPGRPPFDYSYYRCPARSAMIWDSLEKAGIPGIKGVWCHESGYSRGFNVVSIKQMYAGHAHQVGYIASESRAGAYVGRYTVVVDEDIDPSNIDDVVWAMCSRTDPVEDIDIIRVGWSSPLDPRVHVSGSGKEMGYSNSKAIILACKPYSSILDGKFPRTAESSPEMVEEILRKWKGKLDE